MSEKKHNAFNDLSRRSRDFFDDINKIYEEDINNFINDQLNYVRVFSIKIKKEDSKLFLKACYFEKSQNIIVYLTFLK